MEEKKEVVFCWCGRVEPCKHHYGKPKPEKRQRQTPYSGDSKWRQGMGMFQGKEGR